MFLDSAAIPASGRALSLSTVEAESEGKGRVLLDDVVLGRVAVLELLASEDQKLEGMPIL